VNKGIKAGPKSRKSLPSYPLYNFGGEDSI
jgi:hypothetical protein